MTVTQLHEPPQTYVRGQRRPLSWLEIDLNRLQQNVQAVRNLLRHEAGAGEPARLCAVIKKDAYGLGAGPIAHKLAASGVDMLAVYSPEEAEALMDHNIQCPMLLLMPLRTLGRADALYRQAMAGKLHLTLHDVDQVDQLVEMARKFGFYLPVHLHVDTGMCRSGLRPDQVPGVVDALQRERGLMLAGVWSHLATADVDADFAGEQLQAFEQVLSDLPSEGNGAGRPMRHIANSCGMMRGKRFHMDMVRPGLALLGYGSESLSGPQRVDPMPALQPIVRWLSQLVHLQQYPAGSVVGYGSTYRLQRESRLGVVPVGYGDGFGLALSEGAHVRVELADGTDPLSVPVVGRVNMDQIVLDLSDAPASDAALMEATVELYASDPAAVNALPAMAEAAGSHCYELLCRLSPTLPRRYLR